MKIKTSELSGLALDWAVAEIEGRKRIQTTRKQFGINQPVKVVPAYSTNWNQGGPLIEKYNVQTSYNGNGFPRSTTGKYWCAYVCKPSGQEELPSGGGSTPLIAACRAIVASKLGDEVDVPEGLV